MTNGSNEKIAKKRGRPATGRHPITALRLAPTLKTALEDWAERQLGKPSRSEAIRRLIELALAVETQALPSTAQRNQNDELMLGSRRNFSRDQNAAMIFLPVQCRMARAALGLGVRELAAAAKVSVDTVVRFERGEDLKERTVGAIRGALEEGGVEFINGDQPGVRLRKGLRT
jgi:hypothetical protein